MIDHTQACLIAIALTLILGLAFQTVKYMQQRIEELSAENARMREALTMVDGLIKHKFSGSHRAMSDLMLAAQTAFFALNGFYDIEAEEHLK